ncbi:dipeptide epimerase [Prosthecomicrobium hirschii]|uniref:N-acetyl-D-Glu racemase DgcA n=1 Tax=Prosthecodimorpha hirschii TaxID=665126 RepID=UPI00112A38DD|nr:N-acetyl-D-Glu racemase DgcA [Prosthecomicrobium hirschii]TPQ48726.1 dipeptide epimerase [Prosthecomicrobium hirschii]
MTGPHLSVAVERFPIAGSFTISRGSRTEAVVVTATLTLDGATGRGECVPYARYGETVEGVVAAIEAVGPAIAAGRIGHADLAGAMPAGAARNAVDCAFWDLAAKRSGVPAFRVAGLDALKPLVTAYTLSLGTPDSMAEAARAAAHRPLLKVKLGGDGDPERIRAVRAGAPDAMLIVDANEGWTPENLADNLAAAEAAGVRLIEQPLPAGRDGALAGIARRVPVCADESLHGSGDLAALRDRYDAVNIKLDKAGGLTTALEIVAAAERAGLAVMVGCMVGTSLAMAPAILAAQRADFVDLDGPLLLARDRAPGLRYDGSTVYPPEPALWG